MILPLKVSHLLGDNFFVSGSDPGLFEYPRVDRSSHTQSESLSFFEDLISVLEDEVQETDSLRPYCMMP